MRSFAAAILGLTFALPALAQPAVTFGQVTVGGTACQGSETVTLDRSSQVVTLTFTGYEASSGGRVGSPTARATCNVAIPLDVPDGVSVAVVSSGYRLRAKLNPGVEGTIVLEAFLAGDQGPVLTRSLTGPTSGIFVDAKSIPPADQVWTACGQDAILRANTSVRLASDIATVVPSSAVMERVRLTVAIRPC